MMTAKRSVARVVLGVLALAGVAVGQTKAVHVLEPARRLALVIGNAEYAEKPLENPEADARLIEATLDGLGFDEVVLETNLATLPAMVQSVRAFGERLSANDLAFFYYSGHGQQAPGGDRGETRNYLVPTGYDWKTPKAEVEFAALSFEQVRRILGGAQLRVMVLDACRTYNDRQGKGDEGGGLALTVAARGELIAYAAEANAVATDAGEGAGIYAQELAEALRERGAEVAEVFRNVMERVDARTEGAQHPEYKPKIVGRLYLNGHPEDDKPGWINDWKEIEDIEDKGEVLRAVRIYIERYKGIDAAKGHVDLAEGLLARLEKLMNLLPVVSDTGPVVIHQVEPEYSEEAREARYQGTVVLEFEIWEDGAAHNIRIIRSLGLGLDEAAIESVRQSVFAPGTKDGKPVRTTVRGNINFRLL